MCKQRNHSANFFGFILSIRLMCKETKALYFLFEIFNYKHYTYERHPKLGIILALPLFTFT